jgi:hypothetical protein
MLGVHRRNVPCSRREPLDEDQLEFDGLPRCDDDGSECGHGGQRLQEEPKQHVSKRLRLLPTRGPPTATQATDVASVVADAITSTLMVIEEELASDRAAANASNSHVQFAQPKALAQPDTGDLSCVNGTILQTACEALDRSHVAAVHARRLCRAAANVFETEAQAILEAKVMVMEVPRI